MRTHGWPTAKTSVSREEAEKWKVAFEEDNPEADFYIHEEGGSLTIDGRVWDLVGLVRTLRGYLDR